MSKLMFVLRDLPHQSRQVAAQACMSAPEGYVVTIKQPTRTLEQNARMWAMLGDVAEQVIWHGRKLSPEDWKHIFTASLMKQVAVPGLDSGFVVLGQSTSQMTKGQLGDLMTVMEAFGAENGVVFHEDN